MKKIIVGNWKMYGSPGLAKELVPAVSQLAASAHVIICPPATLLAEIAAKLPTGAQDCHSEAEGAHTGDISAAIIKQTGASHVIVGHSERRTSYKETSDTVSKKASRAIEAGLIPIICIGETLAEREAGQTKAVVERQVAESLPDMVKNAKFLVAYEPVWAIGAGKTPTLDEIEQVHQVIIQAISARTGLASGQISVLYGGSVKSGNARAILATRGVAGVLVGGASIKTDEFCAIIAAAE